MEWVAAYYPDVMVAKPRTRATLALVFDKVLCYFPVDSMACGGGHGMSEFYSDDTLVKAGIFELDEHLLLPDIDFEFSPGTWWGTPEELGEFVRLQVTGMALRSCKEPHVVPITDDPNYPIPVSLINANLIMRDAHFQAGTLAMQSLDISLPAIKDISDYEILEARERLRDQLIPFRRAMLEMCPMLRNNLQSDMNLNEVYEETRYFIETRIRPAVEKLRERLRKEKGRFWRTLVATSGEIATKLVLNWISKGPLLAAADAISDCSHSALQFSKKTDFLESIVNDGGLGFLVSAPEHFHR